ncbi:hypothetical protein G7Z17_g3536 [Cylindrodendrum hubeiense]|uniref:Uncharacterized protein n=1 Tax=Cylindrodendrum hubeiense TaxID=595255 RepID=A0A9P5HEF8_9HYPO|nr:hypothetical protein G7Z17_g3536 [Cylindrodendrum hubeiense]
MFDNRILCDAHVQLRTCASANSERLTGGEIEALKSIPQLRRVPKDNDCAKWDHVWMLFFGDHPKPSSPYMGRGPSIYTPIFHRLADYQSLEILGWAWSNSQEPPLQSQSDDPIHDLMNIVSANTPIPRLSRQASASGTHAVLLEQVLRDRAISRPHRNMFAQQQPTVVDPSDVRIDGHQESPGTLLNDNISRLPGNAYTQQSAGVDSHVDHISGDYESHGATFNDENVELGSGSFVDNALWSSYPNRLTRSRNNTDGDQSQISNGLFEDEASTDNS